MPPYPLTSNITPSGVAVDAAKTSLNTEAETPSKPFPESANASTLIYSFAVSYTHLTLPTTPYV